VTTSAYLCSSACLSRTCGKNYQSNQSEHSGQCRDHGS